jgi:2-polyprenyl-3-methyl-5-hydroxy-6-metoxy-1,4-benzoquinol methylase
MGMRFRKKQTEGINNKFSWGRRSKELFLCLAIVSMVLTYSFAESIQQTNISTTDKEDLVSIQDRQDELALLKRRQTDRDRYAIEQKTVRDFSFEKKIDYTPYLSSYIFSVEVDRSLNKIFIISESGNLVFDSNEIEEIKRRVLFMDEFEEDMDRYYFSHADLRSSFNPHRFGFPEYKNVTYCPFTSVNRTDTHLYGFVHRPKTVRLIAGTNFLEDGPYGKQTNPQAVFIDYEFGLRPNGTLEERNATRFKALDEEFNKTKDELDTSKFADRLHYINKACEKIGKTKNDITVLDIGCGLGRVLNTLRLEGYKKLYGVDMDSTKIQVLQQVCRKNALHEITTALINLNSEKVVENICQELQQNEFDLIILNDTLEHIPDPRRTIHTIRSLLAKGGVVLFTGIPDENSLAAQFEEATYGDYNKFTHLNFFTKESIVALARQEAFDVTFLYDDDRGTANLCWSFIFDECLPYVRNGKWFILGKALPDEMEVRDVFPDNALVHNIFSSRPQDGSRILANFERYKLYEKHKIHINLLFKKFFVKTVSKIISPVELKAKLDVLKENLFNTLVLDSPSGISVSDKEQLLTTKDTESTRVKEAFQEAYQLSLRTSCCFFVQRAE